MTPEQKERIRELFLAVCEKDIQERAEYLQRASGGDELVRREVESLLANDDEADTFLQTPALGRTFGGARPESLIEQTASPPADGTPMEQGIETSQPVTHPGLIGSYKILEELGRGGMGIVYLAQQDNPRRRVALKLIRYGVTTSDLLGRFEHEAQILGRLQHPGIAQVHEAGTANAGAGPQPYFAMELVDGVPLTQFAETRELDVRARLELLANVCDAVQHAHQKGVIHRDLKPGNILVTSEGQPKILDFGVARATDGDIQATTLQTDIGQLIGTVSYMSPEQASGDPNELDTRSDVYSLGVVLYELLVGRLPHNLRRTMIHEAVRMIREDEPARLSSINRTLRGDVETIVAKAMEKDKARRYQSASDLAGDIRRYLANEPILARPPSTFYQLSKFTKRNKALVATVTVAFVALTLATTGMTLDRNRAIRAERLAEQRRVEAEGEATKAQAVNDFMERTLSSVDPAQTLGRDVPFRHFLDLAAERIETELRDQPEVQALVYNTLGRTYRNLDFLDDSESHLRRGLALCRSLSGEQSSLELDIMNHLALTLQDKGKLAEAEPLLRQVLSVRQRTLGDEHERTILAINNLGWLLKSRGQYEEARKLFHQALALRRKVSGEDQVETLRTMVNLASALRRLGRMQEAESLSTEAITTCERVLGDKHPTTLYAMSDRVWLLRYSNRSEEAEALARRALDLSRQVLGSDHSSTFLAMNNLAAALLAQRKVDEAETLQRETLNARRRVLGEEHPSTLNSMNNLAVLLYTRHRYAEAEILYSQVLEARRRVLGEEHPEVFSAMFNLALSIRDQLKLDEAELLFIETLAAERRILGDEHPKTLNCMTALGALYAKQNRHDQSALLYEEVWKARQRLLGKDHVATLGSLEGLIASLIELGRFEEAEPLAHECLERNEAAFGSSHRQTKNSIQLLINLYKGWGKPDQEANWRAKLPESAEAAEPPEP